MKSNNSILIATVYAFFVLTSALGQGTLTPPGAPGPTMLTLSQMEPRTPISGSTIITRPGSYYLTTNIISSGDGIDIDASDVTLDLNGFSIYSSLTTPLATGIWLDMVTNVFIFNGHIVSGVTNSSSGIYNGSGFAYGIHYSAGTPVNVRIKNVSVTGVLDDGINVGYNSTVVESCVVNEAGGYGIAADIISDSTATTCYSYAINGVTANNCYGTSYTIGVLADEALNCHGYFLATSGDGNGLVTYEMAENCSGVTAGGTGIALYTGYGAINCAGISNGSGDGLDTQVAQNCYGTSAGSGTGLFATTANNCYGQSGTGWGLNCSYEAVGCVGFGGLPGGGITVNIAAFCNGGCNSGTAIQAYIGNSSFAVTGTNAITHKYNMP